VYEKFYGFSEKPFSLTPDPGFLYLGDEHQTALTMMEYGLTLHGGVTVITGEVGCGKTTLMRRMLELINDEYRVGLISNTHTNMDQLLQWILLAFGLDYANKSKTELYQALMDFVIEEYGQGRRTLIVIDESQNLDLEALEELRMLSNINSGKDIVLQILLVGQPELLEKLKIPEMRQFAQRISVDYHLRPLVLNATREYIRHRLQATGGDPDMFDEMALGAVHYHTGGVPRLINRLCESALVYGFAEDKRSIGMETIFEVVSDKKKGGLTPYRGQQ